ncbi:hypothetical protein SFRURICE_014158, partial [Spodoptera frugiperda]
FNNLSVTCRLYGWRGGCATAYRATCSGLDSRTKQVFMAGCHVYVYVNLYVCKRTHDTGENPSANLALVGAANMKKKTKKKK